MCGYWPGVGLIKQYIEMFWKFVGSGPKPFIGARGGLVHRLGLLTTAVEYGVDTSQVRPSSVRILARSLYFSTLLVGVRGRSAMILTWRGRMYLGIVSAA